MSLPLRTGVWVSSLIWTQPGRTPLTMAVKFIGMPVKIRYGGQRKTWSLWHNESRRLGKVWSPDDGATKLFGNDYWLQWHSRRSPVDGPPHAGIPENANARQRSIDGTT